MRYPQHLVLDHSIPSNQKTTTTWSITYAKQIARDNKLNVQKPANLTMTKNVAMSSNNTFATTLFDVNFLRKDKLYTKLKYSRCPQYDIVSGGWAALFAGLVGFLISEKFGIELVDSGDFYTVFMYGVFLCFSTRPLLRILDKNSTWTTVLTLKSLTQFFMNLLTLLLRYIASIIARLR